MEKVSLSDIRKELSFASKEELVSICLRMARLKKENKEHLAYLLFSKDEAVFIAEINEEITLAMHDLRNINTFQAKKVLQKTLRTITKNKKFCLSKVYEMEVMLHFVREMEQKKVPYSSSSYLFQFYAKQVIKLGKILPGLDEDLQTDYQSEVEELCARISF